MRVELVGRSSDRRVAWERLGDTDFMNRAVDAGKVSMELRPRDGGSALLTGTMAGPLGLPLQFTETRNGWVRYRWFKQHRIFQRAPIAQSRFELFLEDDGEGVVPRIVLDLEPAARLFSPLLAARASVYRTRWQAVLDGLPAPGAAARAVHERQLPEQMRAAVDRWRSKADTRVVDAVTELLSTERDHALRSIRAFAVADRFGLDRDETLTSMIRSVPAGLLELYWSVRCTRCKGEVASTTSLSDLADHADCPSCGITFGTDLGESVEVLFAPHPAIAPRVSERFCTMFPTGAPSLHATFPLGPGEAIEDVLEVARGTRYTLGSGNGAPDLDVVVEEGGADHVSWETGAVGRWAVAPGLIKIGARNASGADQRVVLADAASDQQSVPAARVATMPEFRRDLGVQVLSSNVRIGTRSVALLFTDLSGSTAMYEAVGDAAAYALVRDHFELLGAVIEEHGGSVVKTIGDAVMASFHSADAAVGAALAMREAFDGWVAREHPTLEVRLNLGVHVGPALAVHSDGVGLDWFGRHVNLSARAQGAAKDGALVMTEAVVSDPVVKGRLAKGGWSPEAFDAQLKGIGTTTLYRLARPD